MTYIQHKKKYLQQRNLAKWRGIPWRFTYTTWWRKWCESRKWQERGCHRYQYVMSRYGDTGPYSCENTKIVTLAANTREAQLGRKHTKWAKVNMSIARIGNKNTLGYRHTEESKRKISQAMTGRKFSLEHRSKIAEANRHRYISIATCAKISASNLGKSLSTSTKAKMSKAQQARRRREKNNVQK